MRVIAGKAKGRMLIAPEGLNTRPIMAKMKEALFSMWQFDIYGANFLDLFAGSGSMGIEAISRGAKRAVFVEMDRNAIDVIKKNIKTCNFGDEAEVYQDDVFARIQWFKKTGQKFDIIYLDPPFTVDSIFIPVMEALDEADILAEDGVIVAEHWAKLELPEELHGFEKIKERKYGHIVLSIYG